MGYSLKKIRGCLIIFPAILRQEQTPDSSWKGESRDYILDDNYPSSGLCDAWRRQ